MQKHILFDRSFSIFIRHTSNMTHYTEKKGAIRNSFCNEFETYETFKKVSNSLHFSKPLLSFVRCTKPSLVPYGTFFPCSDYTDAITVLKRNDNEYSASQSNPYKKFSCITQSAMENLYYSSSSIIVFLRQVKLFLINMQSHHLLLLAESYCLLQRSSIRISQSFSYRG